MKKLFTLLTLLLTVVGGAKADEVKVTWLPNNMSSSTTSGAADVDDILTVNDFSISSDVNSGDLVTYDSKKWGNFTKKDVSDSNKGPKNGIDKNDYLTFTVTVKTGYTFTPTGITAYAVGIGTGNNGVGIFTEIQNENIASGYTATNSSSAASAPQMTKSVTSSAITEGNTYTFYIYFSQNNTTSNKGVAIRDVILTGTYEANDAPNSAPSFATNLPTTDNAFVGAEKTLLVEVTAKPAPTYQWYSCTDAEKTDAEAIDGATTSTYTFTPAVAGTYYYYVVATNTEGSATSNVVTLTVTAAPPANPTFTVYGNTVQIACATDGATVYYELDNADVKSSATKSTYSGAFIPASSGTIYAYAEKSGLQSEVVSKAVTLSTVGEVVGGKLVTMQPTTKDGSKYSEKTYNNNGFILVSTADLEASARGVYTYHFKTSGTITVTAPSSGTIKSIKIIGTSNDGSKVSTITAGSGATVISTPAELMQRDVTVGGVQAMTEIVLTVDEPTAGNSVSFTLGRESRFYVEVYGSVSVSTLSGRNYATYVTTSKLDFASAEGVTAYIATGLNGTTSVNIEPVDVVPAGTPIIVKTDTKGATVNVPVTTADASDVSGNKLIAGDGTTAATTSHYFLKEDQFHQATSGTLQAGKAYLYVTAGAPTLSIDFGTTNIATTNFTNDTNNSGEYFNLAGQRVAQPTKGLYIMNGKKVIVK